MSQKVGRPEIRAFRAPDTELAGRSRSVWTRDSADQAALVLRYVLESGFEQVEQSGRVKFVIDLAELLRSFGLHASLAELQAAGLGEPALVMLRTLLTEPIELQVRFALGLRLVLVAEDDPRLEQFFTQHQGVDARLRAALRGQ